MLQLQNAQLTVEILDPVHDQDRFGPRYCTGGYIFQISDHNHGPLMSGPSYPDSFNWYDGQGIPDSFHLGPLRSPDDASTTALIPGIGLCDLAGPRVLEYCDWQIESSPTALEFRTSHTYHFYACVLERRVSLHERTIRSTTRMRNTGARAIGIHWYPHPFYPPPATDELCCFTIPVQIPEQSAYELGENGFVYRRNWPWQQGYFQALSHESHAPLTVLQRHPTLGMVGAVCSYIPAFFPIWGNQSTFSWEPYYERTLAPGQQSEWWLAYSF